MTDNANEVAPIMYTFANRSPAPELESLLAMFYTGAYDNRLGIMQAKNRTTELEEVLLVGVDVSPDGKTQCYPLARLLAVEEATNYFAPDGTGGWYDPTDADAVKSHQDSMKPIDEALVDVPL